MSEVYVLIHDKGAVQYTKTFYEKMESFDIQNKEGWGVYKAVNEFEATNEEMKEAGVKTKRNIQFLKKLRAIYADLDIAKKGDGQTREEKEAKKKILIDALLAKWPPSYIIDTSNGIQPVWNIDEESVSDETQKKYVNVINGIIEWSKKFGAMADQVKDVTRVIRAPNYFHMKEEPYMCLSIHDSGCNNHTLSLLAENFPYLDCILTNPETQHIKGSDPVSIAIDNIDFQDLIIRAFGSIGRGAEFDKEGRLILDSRLTGTFQGKRDTKDYLASTSHEPFEGNRITAVADIKQISNKEARQWIVDEFDINYEKLVIETKVKEQIAELPKEKVHKDYRLRYTWGTPELNKKFGIIKRTTFIALYAHRGQGKTTYIFDMAAKNAKLGHTVLFVSLEMDTDDIINDLARRYAGITIEEEYNYEIPSRKKLAFDKKYNEIKEITNLKLLGIRRGDNLDWEVIKEVIKTQEGADLIIVDNMGRIGKRQNENEYDKQNRVTDSIMSFTSAENIPVILLHHRRKSQSTTGKGMDEMSGSGKIADGADMVVRVKRNTDPEAKGGDKYETTLFLEKARGYPEEIHSIFFNKGTFDDKYHIDLDKLFNR